MSASNPPAPASNSPPATRTSPAPSAWRGTIIDEQQPSFRDAPLGAGPESITTIGGYGFRARARARPGMTQKEEIHGRPPERQTRIRHSGRGRHRPRLRSEEHTSELQSRLH